MGVVESSQHLFSPLSLRSAEIPFVSDSFLYNFGLAAGALALALLTAAWLGLRAPLAELAASYGSDFTLNGVDPRQAGIVLLGATVLGWIGAGIVTGHFLRQTRPTQT